MRQAEQIQKQATTTITTTSQRFKPDHHSCNSNTGSASPRCPSPRIAENSAAYLLPTLRAMRYDNPHLAFRDVGAGSGSITIVLASHRRHRGNGSVSQSRPPGERSEGTALRRCEIQHGHLSPGPYPSLRAVGRSERDAPCGQAGRDCGRP
jgi:hypothetical protein